MPQGVRAIFTVQPNNRFPAPPGLTPPCPVNYPRPTLSFMRWASGFTGDYYLNTDLPPRFGLTSPRSLRDAARTAGVLVPKTHTSAGLSTSIILMPSYLIFLLEFPSLSW